METIEMQVQNFLDRCDDLTYSKPILAPSKINAILRSIANAPALVKLFQECTKNFDYPAAQQSYILPADETEEHAVIILPNDRTKRIAFVFCLLTGIDNHDVNFNPLLLTCFGDGTNYESSFTDFCEKMIIPFEADVANEVLNGNPGVSRAIFSPIVNLKQTQQKRSRQIIMADMNSTIVAEKELLNKEDISEADKEAALAILHEFSEALKDGKDHVAQALLLGYNYFTEAVQADKENVIKLFRLTEEL